MTSDAWFARACRNGLPPAQNEGGAPEKTKAGPEKIRTLREEREECPSTTLRVNGTRKTTKPAKEQSPPSQSEGGAPARCGQAIDSAHSDEGAGHR